MVEPGVWHVELRRPEKRNALDTAMYEALAGALGTAGGRPDVHAVLLSGQGEVFCAGNDLTDFARAWPQPPHGPVVRFLEALHGLEIPVVAAVQGVAVGIGATMLLHCDMVVAEPRAFLRFPFVERGITVEGGGSCLLPQRLGYARAMDILLTGRRVPAGEALALGLVSAIARDRPPLDVAREAAAMIAARSPVAVRATKRLVRETSPPSLPVIFEREVRTINDLLRVQAEASNSAETDG